MVLAFDRRSVANERTAAVGTKGILASSFVLVCGTIAPVLTCGSGETRRFQFGRPSSKSRVPGMHWLAQSGSSNKIEGRTRARMFLNQSLRDARDETTWPDVYPWFGEKLSLLYETFAPRLREEMDRHERMTLTTGPSN